MELSNAVPDNIKNILQSFICPITTQIVQTPIVASDGRIYEENAFKEFIENNNKSPITREPITTVYHISHDIKNVIDTLETMYPEIKKIRYISDNTYLNNVDSIKKFIDRNQYFSLLKYTNFYVRDMIHKGFIDKIIKNKSANVLIHIIKNSEDLDSETGIAVICKSLEWPKNENFVLFYLQNYNYALNYIDLGILFNTACEHPVVDYNLIIYIINYCNDIRSLTMFVDNRDWSYNLHHSNSLIKGKIQIKDAYYKRILELCKSNEISVIKHNYDVNTFWNTLVDYDNDVIEEEEYEQEYSVEEEYEQADTVGEDVEEVEEEIEEEYNSEDI